MATLFIIHYKSKVASWLCHDFLGIILYGNYLFVKVTKWTIRFLSEAKKYHNDGQD